MLASIVYSYVTKHTSVVFARNKLSGTMLELLVHNYVIPRVF